MLCEFVLEYKKYLMKDGRMVVKLNNALYGCIESAKLWYQQLKGTLEGLGFIPNPEKGAALTVGSETCSAP